MIDIIIPAYNAKETIFKTLASISLQTIKNSLNVYIVNDASDYNYQEEISFFKNWINIVELTLSKNSGPGIARQYGIDNSNSEYIMFIDADDTFYNCYSVELLYKKIKETKMDLVISNILYERDNKREKYEANFVYMHGKIYKRSYLINNNIKFNDTRANEDNGDLTKFNVSVKDNYAEFETDHFSTYVLVETNATNPKTLDLSNNGFIIVVIISLVGIIALLSKLAPKKKYIR